ncbi:MAG TPA: hypothetical protein DIT10_21380 [Chryseobacterium sp.]|nr:hypothetical protein [Chryseobacterium sp.]
MAFGVDTNKIFGSIFFSIIYYKIEHEPGGRSDILLHPPGPQQNTSALPQPKLGNSLLHILNPPLMLFRLSLEIFFKFFIIMKFLILICCYSNVSFFTKTFHFFILFYDIVFEMR